MAVETNALQTFLAEARQIVADSRDDTERTTRLAPLMQRLAATPDVLAPEQTVCQRTDQATRYVLNEDPDGLTLWAVVWPSGYSTLPHNHHTWAVVVGLRGAETNTFWLRSRGDESDHMEMHRTSEVTMRPGEVVTLLGMDIHSVANREAEPSLSLHLYGKNPDRLAREQFDPETGAARPMGSGVAGAGR